MCFFHLVSLPQPCVLQKREELSVLVNKFHLELSPFPRLSSPWKQTLVHLNPTFIWYSSTCHSPSGWYCWIKYTKKWPHIILNNLGSSTLSLTKFTYRSPFVILIVQVSDTTTNSCVNLSRKSKQILLTHITQVQRCILFSHLTMIWTNWFWFVYCIPFKQL